jgi:hypothetical protein
VTNGETTVGPVSTSLLVRGVIADLIPSDCLVREARWTQWRNLETLREVRAVRRARQRFGAIALVPESERPAPFDPFATFRHEIQAARDSSAVLAALLLDAVRRTDATVGAIHRRRSPYVGYVTSVVIGPGMAHRLGSVLSKDDGALALVHRGVTLSMVPHGGALSGQISARLGAFPAAAGVLVAGVHRRNGLEALIELGRADHPFRAGDDGRVTEAARIAGTRIDEIWSLSLS